MTITTKFTIGDEVWIIEFKGGLPKTMAHTIKSIVVNNKKGIITTQYAFDDYASVLILEDELFTNREDIIKSL